MKRHLIRRNLLFILWAAVVGGAVSCHKDDDDPAKPNLSPKADFSFTVKNPGTLPTTVSFISSSANATALKWRFDNGATSPDSKPETVYSAKGTYNVKLVASNQYGADSITKQVEITLDKPKADFSFTVQNPGVVPATVSFTSLASNAAALKWTFGNGATSSANTPVAVYAGPGTYSVKLVTSNQSGQDSVTKSVTITVTKPKADFTYTISSIEVLPVTVTTTNTSVGSGVTYKWSFGNAVSTQVSPSNTFVAGGIYNIKLVATNAGGKDSITRQIRISPYPQAYTSFNGTALNLYAWEGSKVMFLSRSNTLNRATMFKWIRAMDATYAYYLLCTTREPGFNPPTYINNRTTIADVAVTCGAGCGYLGATGIELQNTYFDIGYNSINNSNQYDQILFYEFGRNFWFYGGQLAYKANDPVTTGYAVFMRFMAMEAAGVNGAPFGSWSFPTFRSNVENLVDTYAANTSLTWANTLGAGQGVPGSGLGATDLFASFCFRLRRDYGGDVFIRNLWKNAGSRLNATTTQDAVDSFFLAACAAAQRNLTTQFQSWRWPLSTGAIIAASIYP